MSATAIALRLAGDTVTALGSWYRRPRVIALGLTIVAVGWSQGLVGRLAGQAAHQ